MTTLSPPKQLDGVLGTQTSRLLLSYCISRSHGTVVCTTTCKERNCCRPRDPASWPNMAATPDDCEGTATVALPTAASGGSISGDLGSSAALDAFSTVYEFPLTRFKNRQTNKQTRRCSWNTDLAFTIIYILSYYSSRSHGTVVCTTTCKERNCCRPRDPASWPNMAATPDDCERTATVALPTAASGGSISGNLGSSAALYVFSTVYELPLTRF